MFTRTLIGCVAAGICMVASPAPAGLSVITHYDSFYVSALGTWEVGTLPVVSLDVFDEIYVGYPWYDIVAAGHATQEASWQDTSFVARGHADSQERWMSGYHGTAQSVIDLIVRSGAVWTYSFQVTTPYSVVSLDGVRIVGDLGTSFVGSASGELGPGDYHLYAGASDWGDFSVTIIPSPAPLSLALLSALLCSRRRRAAQ